MDSAKLACYWAGRYRWALERRNDLDMEDLQQAAFVGILRAVKDYKDEKAGLVTLAGYYARNEIRELLGIRNGKLPPVLESLDEPLNDETEDTRLDLLADETIPDPDAGIIEEERKQTVRDAVDRLQEDQRQVVRLRYFSGMTYQQTADEMNITRDRVATLFQNARRNLRHDRYLKALAEVNRRTPYLLGVGVTRFNSTFTSAVEEIVLLRERLLQKVLQVQEECEEHCKQEENVI